MTAFGTLAFLQPAFLTALIALPILWWLLRVSPPAPRRVRFPGVRLLLDLVDRERTPDRTPWWLLLLRMLALAALIFAFAQPVLNPKERLSGEAPVTVVLDGGWASAPDWPARRAAALEIIAQAREAERPVALINLSDPAPAPEAIEFRDAETQSRVLAAAEPYPWRPDPSRWLQAAEALEETDVIWLHDGLDEASAAELAETFAAKGALRLIGPRLLAKALTPPEIREGALIATVARAETGVEETARVAAIGRDPNVDGDAVEPGGVRRLAASEAVFEADDVSAEAEIDLPPQLRNALARIEIVAAGHAGAAALLDDRWRRRTVALVSGERERSDQPLLSGVHYLRAALAPHADYRESSLVSALGGEEAADLGGIDRIAVEDVANAWADVIILSDIGRLDIATEEALIAWIQRGGLLVRFAGPRMAAAAAERSQIGRRAQARGGDAPAEDPLLPTRLRGGGRALGGALSWAAPQTLQPFPDTGPFAGLKTPEEATVTRQVLAEPGPELSGRVWAALADGTPLVTSKSLGEGRVVLFHVTASAAWSNLPLSGLFVDMMGRLVAVAPGLAASAASLAEDAAVWKPETLMDAYGELAPAPDDAAPVAGADLAAGSKLGVAPGIYVSESGDAPTRLALSATPVGATLETGPETPAGAVAEVLSGQSETALKPWLLALGLLLLMIDSVIAILLAGGFRKASTAALILAVGLAGIMAAPAPAWAQDNVPAENTQTPDPERTPVDPAEQRAALETVLGYIKTGDATIDRVSAAGLYGLSARLYSRTAIEPGEPAEIDLEADDIAVYAILYWPITSRQSDLSDVAVRKLNAFMRTGGLLIIDTRDAHQTFGAGEGPNARHLRRLAGGLDLPPLNTAPRDHLLTRSFYLLDQLPGRWAGGQVWVEARPPDAADGVAPERVNANDGVSPIIIGAADWAGAWAVDDAGAPMFPMGRGGERQRELAYRVGINMAMYAYTGNYKSDQVHIPALLERLGN